jgi:uncharacterized coiled-coil protein SlyX
MVIPAAIMDSAINKRIDQLEITVAKLEGRVTQLEITHENLKQEIDKDVHKHVKTLVNQIQTLENEIKALKQ